MWQLDRLRHACSLPFAALSFPVTSMLQGRGVVGEQSPAQGLTLMFSCSPTGHRAGSVLLMPRRQGLAGTSALGAQFAF